MLAIVQDYRWDPAEDLVEKREIATVPFLAPLFPTVIYSVDRPKFPWAIGNLGESHLERQVFPLFHAEPVAFEDDHIPQDR